MKVVSFDGMRASGKSTQLLKLDKVLKEKGLITKIIHEKDYEPFRSLALLWNKKEDKSFYYADIRNFAKARKEIYQKEVYPFINKLDYLLLDRYIYTSAVYQQGILSMDEVISINLREDIPIPERSFILICDPNVAIRRMKKRDKGVETLEEIIKRRELYIELSRQHPELYIIDTTHKSEEEVFEEIKNILNL